MELKFQTIKKVVEKELSRSQKPCPAHGIEHVMRVYTIALTLAKNEDVDRDVIQAATLLHDIGSVKEMEDSTGKTDHAIESAKMAEPILKNLGFSKEKIKHIQACIISHRYRTGNKPKTLEAKIVFDADKLETVGAIGIARAFAWVGRNNAHIYKKMDIQTYVQENLGGKINGRIHNKSKHSPQLQWETKDQYILDFLQTEQAKRIATERMNFSKHFLDRLEQEIQGKL